MKKRTICIYKSFSLYKIIKLIKEERYNLNKNNFEFSDDVTLEQIQEWLKLLDEKITIAKGCHNETQKIKKEKGEETTDFSRTEKAYHYALINYFLKCKSRTLPTQDKLIKFMEGEKKFKSDQQKNPEAIHFEKTYKAYQAKQNSRSSFYFFFSKEEKIGVAKAFKIAINTAEFTVSSARCQAIQYLANHLSALQDGEMGRIFKNYQHLLREKDRLLLNRKIEALNQEKSYSKRWARSHLL